MGPQSRWPGIAARPRGSATEFAKASKPLPGFGFLAARAVRQILKVSDGDRMLSRRDPQGLTDPPSLPSAVLDHRLGSRKLNVKVHFLRDGPSLGLGKRGFDGAPPKQKARGFARGAGRRRWRETPFRPTSAGRVKS